MKAWTDYPFTWLGDTAGKEAPIREVDVTAYDQDKYCHVRVAGGEDIIKRCYIYQKPGRCGLVKSLTDAQLSTLPEWKP